MKKFDIYKLYTMKSYKIAKIIVIIILFIIVIQLGIKRDNIRTKNFDKSIQEAERQLEMERQLKQRNKETP